MSLLFYSCIHIDCYIHIHILHFLYQYLSGFVCRCIFLYISYKYLCTFIHIGINVHLLHTPLQVYMYNILKDHPKVDDNAYLPFIWLLISVTYEHTNTRTSIMQNINMHPITRRHMNSSKNSKKLRTQIYMDLSYLDPQARVLNYRFK